MKRKKRVSKINDVEKILNNIDPTSTIQVVVTFKLADNTPSNVITTAQKIMDVTRTETKKNEKNLDIYPALGCMSVEASIPFIKTLIQQKKIGKVSVGKGLAELHEKMLLEK